MSGLPATGSVPQIPLPAASDGSWTLLGAVVCALFVLGVSQLLALGFVQIWLGWGDGPGPWLDPAAAAKLPVSRQQWMFIVVQVAAQLVELALLWWIAGRRGQDRRAALGLAPVRLSAMGWARLILLLFAVKTGATLTAAATLSINPAEELGPFVEMAKVRHVWIGLLFAVVLAAVTEELVFRGILSRTLEATRLGFWGGAALANIVFAVVHLQYGLGGQLVVFAIGLTLSWIRRQTGSLWPCMVCHAANNAVALLAMKAVM